MSSIYWVEYVSLLSFGITHTVLPTAFYNNTMSPWRQGGLNIKWRNTLFLCCEFNPEHNLYLLVPGSTSFHPTLYIVGLKAEQNHHLTCIQLKRIYKVEVNWTSTVESPKKKMLMCKNEASPGAKRASLWGRMDHMPGPEASCCCQVLCVWFAKIKYRGPLYLGSWIKPCGTFDKTVNLGAGPNSIWEAAFDIYFSILHIIPSCFKFLCH